METIDPKKKKYRRSGEQLEQDIITGIEKLVCKTGFTDTPITTVLNETSIDPNVFYRRYETVYDIYEYVAQKHEYWFNKCIHPNDALKSEPKVFYTNTLKEIYKEFRNDKIAQKMVLWEISEKNDTTIRTAAIKETLNGGIMLYYKQLFKDSGIDIVSHTALLIGGIYYLTLHNNISTYCFNDFTSTEGIIKIEGAIDKFTELIFNEMKHKNKNKRTANMLKEEGFKNKKICYYLGIKEDYLKELLDR